MTLPHLFVIVHQLGVGFRTSNTPWYSHDGCCGLAKKVANANQRAMRTPVLSPRTVALTQMDALKRQLEQP